MRSYGRRCSSCTSARLMFHSAVYPCTFRSGKLEQMARPRVHYSGYWVVHWECCLPPPPTSSRESQGCKVEKRVLAIFEQSLLVLECLVVLRLAAVAPILIRGNWTLWQNKPFHSLPPGTNPSLNPLLGELWSRLKSFVMPVTVHNLSGGWFLLVNQQTRHTLTHPH